MVELPAQCLLRYLAQRLFHLFRRLRQAFPGGRGYCELADRLDDMQGGERCPMLRCDLPGARDREIGSRREIGGDQHLTEGVHRRSCPIIEDQETLESGVAWRLAALLPDHTFTRAWPLERSGRPCPIAASRAPGLH